MTFPLPGIVLLNSYVLLAFNFPSVIYLCSVLEEGCVSNWECKYCKYRLCFRELFEREPLF